MPLYRKSYERNAPDGRGAISWKLSDLSSEDCGKYHVEFYRGGFLVTQTSRPIEDEFDAIRLVDGWTSNIL